jgi:hypothetical protein
MTYLRDLDPTADLKHLQNIKQVAGMGDKDLYFATCYNFRATLTHIFAQYEEKDALSILSDFKSLNHLDFHNDFDKNLTLIEAQENCCNKLISFKFSTKYTASSRMDALVYDQDKQQHALDEYSSNLQSLLLEFPTLAPTYIKNITEFMPAQLNTLDIDLGRIDIYD